VAQAQRAFGAARGACRQPRRRQRVTPAARYHPTWLVSVQPQRLMVPPRACETAHAAPQPQHERRCFCVPSGAASLRAVWETRASRAPGHSVTTTVRGAPEGGDRAVEWPLSVESPGSAAAPPVAGAGVAGRPELPAPRGVGGDRAGWSSGQRRAARDPGPGRRAVVASPPRVRLAAGTARQRLSGRSEEGKSP